jgi:hypothetical protein
MAFNKINFSAEAEKDLIPAWKDYVNHYRKENFSTKKTVSGSKSLAEKEALVNKIALSEVSKFANIDTSFIGQAQMSTNPMYRWAFFAVVNKMVDIIIPDVVAEDFYAFANVSTVGKGNSGKFTVKSADLFEVSINGNSRRHVNAQRQFTGEKTLTPVNHTITTQVDLYRVMAKEESLADYAMKVILSIEAEIALDIAYAMQNSFETRTANFKESGFTPASFKTIATRVAAANGGRKAVAVGTEIALMDVMPTDDYLKLGLGETYNSIGYLPVFLNTPLIALAQKIDWASADYDFAISDKFIYFVSPGVQKLVQVVFEDEGLYIVDDVFANGNLIQNASMHKSWITGIVSAGKHGVMKLA